MRHHQFHQQLHTLKLDAASASCFVFSSSKVRPAALAMPLACPSSFFSNSIYKHGFSSRSCRFAKLNTSLLERPIPPRFFCNFNNNDSDIMSQLELGTPQGKRKPEKRVNGIFWILLLNLGIYVADHVFQVQGIKTLYLYHNWPAWYQFVTATFCHYNWNHLSSNLFFLYIFGKFVEEEEGNFALWLSYILTGAGANLVSWLVLPRNAVSVGASGAVFGLFAISVLVKMSWDWRKILEVLILGQFVVEKVIPFDYTTCKLITGVCFQPNYMKAGMDIVFQFGDGSCSRFNRVGWQFSWRLCPTKCKSHSTSLRCPYWCSFDMAS